MRFLAQAGPGGATGAAGATGPQDAATVADAWSMTAREWTWALGLLLAGVAAALLLTLAVRHADRKAHPIAGTLRATRNLLVPVILLHLFLRLGLRLERKEPTIRVVDTLIAILAIHVALSLVNALIFGARRVDHAATRVPKLFVDVARFALVVIGGAVAVSLVWEWNLGNLVAALGVSSIVVGLALQDTLGNLFAGIALLFERPFSVGEWVRVGDAVGEVVEMNWRAVHMRTRANDIVVVPNSILGKERIQNFSRPTPMHGEYHHVGFSYDDPPNKVKRVLTKAALATRGIAAQPMPDVRVKSYADSAVNYEIKFTIEDYARQPEVVDEFMTQIWYAARRNRLTIPLPIRTVFKTEVPVAAVRAARDTRQALAAVPVFVPLSREEMESIARDSVIQSYGDGELVVSQGDPGDALYIILEGRAVVSVRDESGADREVSRLATGEFFGEMALLTGEPRAANVTAVGDLEVIVVYKEALQSLLAQRPGLAQEIAEIMEARRQGLKAAMEMQKLSAERRQQIREGASALVSRIKRFLGI